MEPRAPTIREAALGLNGGRRHWLPPLVFASLLLGAVGVIVFPAHAETIGPGAMLVAYAGSSWTVLRKAQAMSGRDRVAWSLVGLGFLSALFGILTVAMVHAVAGSVPAFGPADLFFIATYLLIFGGFILLPDNETGRAQRTRVLLDSVIGALAIGAFMWVLVLDDLLSAFAGTSAWDRWVGTAYPVLDVGLLVLVAIVVTRRTAFRFDLRLLLFGLGAVAQGLADIWFLRSGVGTTFAEAEPNYLAFLFAATLYFSAAIILDRQPAARVYADRNANVWAMVAPYTAALALVVLLLVQLSSIELDFHAAVALYATLVVGLLVVTRQVVAIHENRVLVERQRSELVSSISHELRTPLTTVVGFLNLLAERHADLSESEREEIVGTARQQARYLQQLVSDLEPLKELGPDDFVLDETVVPMAEVAARAMESVEAGSTSTAIEVELGLEARIDQRRVQQVLVNLITNAIRYGGGRVLVEISSEGSDLVIEVHDDGPGVLKKWELAIWSRFERGPNRLNAVQPGSGIGLAVVAAITRAHGGTVGSSRSERLGGARFRVVLDRRVVFTREQGRVEDAVASRV